MPHPLWHYSSSGCWKRPARVASPLCLMQEFRIVQSKYWFCTTHCHQVMHAALGLSAALYLLQSGCYDRTARKAYATVDKEAGTSHWAHHQQQIMRCLTLCSTIVGHASSECLLHPGPATIRWGSSYRCVGPYLKGGDCQSRSPGSINIQQSTSRRRSATVVWAAACHVRFETSKQNATAVAASLLDCFHCQTCL